MLKTFARQVNLEAQKQDLLAKMSKPWHIDHCGRICIDEVISEDELVLFPTYKIKRNKKHYKPKFTL